MSVRTGAKASEFCPLFDGPDGGGVIERRNESIVAPQALYLMNDPFVDQLARGLAMRVEATLPKGTLGQKINRLYEIALGRPATSVELEIGQTLVQDSAAGEGWPRLCLIVLCTNEFLYVD